MTLRISSWNVNSIRTRLHQLLPWLKETSPDIVLLQEIKTTKDTFPYLEIEEMGYNVAIHGQKSYNGVAILSKFPLSDVLTALPLATGESDDEARYIEAVVSLSDGALRVASVYVPNGQAVDSPKFAYKLAFLKRLEKRLRTLLAWEEAWVLGGDYNVAPKPLDVYDAQKLEGTICFHPQEREAWRRIVHLGCYDAYRLMHPNERCYSWWDYRTLLFDLHVGLRIDHLLLSPQAADRLSACEIETGMRLQERPSDHAPVTATLSHK